MNRTIPQLIGEIASLTALISANTKHDVCAWYSGHTQDLSIRIYIDGWCDGKECITQTVWCNKEDYSEESILKNLSEAKHKLIELARKDKLDFSKLPYEVEEVKHYKLV